MKRLEQSKGYGDYSKEELISTVSKLDQSVDDLTSMALAFVLQHKQVSAILAGASSQDQIISTMRAYHQSVSSNSLEQVKQLLREDRYTGDRI